MGNTIVKKSKKPEDIKWKDAEPKAVQVPAEPRKEAAQPPAPPIKFSNIKKWLYLNPRSMVM